MTLETKKINEAAMALSNAVRSGVPCSPIRDLLPAGDVDAAYAVQELGTKARVERGGRIVGRKIGLTSVAVQRQLGVGQPDYGVLFADMDVPEGETVPWHHVLQPKVEAEVAFVLGKDLRGDEVTAAEVLAAVEYAVAAIEIVGSRIANWDIRIVDTVADNASSGLFVLGHVPRRLSEIDVVGLRMKLSRANDPASSGSGKACLGSPLSSLRWLARTMVRRGHPLCAGDVVLSGALGPMVAVQPGDRFEAEIEGLGTVETSFGESDG
ncbi:fumarylacetoacetate hydrolase family protein [Bradyrhizobium sp. NP1]|uniref:2-keto-4-pentenoate hydratase n=1 Tax=Bradyrhizobium sp. NP1 TaxID=3049772 RepID=UPI0025A505C2|nr:fumarylacetoacetate hydrolase family protein [Bradyrhizobium sp. NP1]WJR75844.1 fumarylacetoacetate hydrolase family protein [Bradyrhizobium sp. NP1]